MHNASSAFYAPGILPLRISRIQSFGMAKKKRSLRRTFIKEWRKYRSEMTQEKLAARINVSQETVSRVENGRQPYTQEMLEAIADALMCEPADLLMRDPTQPGAIWSIWDQIPSVQRDQAVRVLETFTKHKAS